MWLFACDDIGKPADLQRTWLFLLPKWAKTGYTALFSINYVVVPADWMPRWSGYLAKDLAKDLPKA